MTFTRTVPLTVTSEAATGSLALAAYAESATKPTQTAVGLGGGFEATVPPLDFEAKPEAGEPFRPGRRS